MTAEADDEPEVEFYRTCGNMICATCGEPYWRHPWGGPIGWQDRQFLRQLCNGDLVKL